MSFQKPDLGSDCFSSRSCTFYISRYVVYKKYSPNTILLKLPFCISPCSETPLAECDLIIHLHSKSLKKCLKSFEYPLRNIKKNRPHAFCMNKGGYQESLNRKSCKLFDFVQTFGPQLSIFYYLVLVRSI